eukprot:TRINITY_DN32931_c0_g1_i1.p1 TRINITY_DN32931_c0_g1~~TRINITY_DN32931_c0_g1_i1.p1  ORF type:complete len:395 (+),score=176.67 TRINITY_DN32931_c0_g1_i1:47-1231(+)
MTDEVELSDVSSDLAPEAPPTYDHAAIPPPFRAYVGGLSRHTALPQLQKFLQGIDPNVNHIHIAVEKGDKAWCKGFAHCSFTTEGLRQRAVAELTGRTFNGRKVRVQEAGDHFMVRRQRDDDEAVLKERGPLKRDLNAQAALERQEASQLRKTSKTANSWENQQGSWDNWKGESDWGQQRVAAGTQKRWDPSQAPAAPQGSKKKQELEAKKAQAVANEDYELAAKIKKQIDALGEVEGKIEKLQAAKKAAVEAEDFAKAAELKKEIEAIENAATTGTAPKPVPQQKPAQPAAKKEAAPKKEAPAAKEGASKGETNCKRCAMGKECKKACGKARSKQNPASGAILELQKQAQARLDQQKGGAKRKADEDVAPTAKKAKQEPAASAGFMACMDEEI